ncbi:MAG: ThiF family adenylyltransferase [Bacteroidales bacterium]|nr:ThiF family adenylyltransferase [Bacteroidales bacterium]
MEFYDRNRIYIPAGNQEEIKNKRVVLAGTGLGSVIAECLLRLGFENICLIDGDVVETTNLNRQNYTLHDVGKPKVTALRERLESINPRAAIECKNQFLDSETGIRSVLSVGDIAINAMDFNSDAPFLFDKVCTSLNIPVIHPYNLGWAGCAFVVTPASEGLTYIQTTPLNFEKQFVEYAIKRLKHQNYNTDWLEQCLTSYMEEKDGMPPPQLPVASWITAGLCTSLIYKLAIGDSPRLFPDFYFLPAI